MQKLALWLEVYLVVLLGTAEVLAQAPGAAATGRVAAPVVQGVPAAGSGAAATATAGSATAGAGAGMAAVSGQEAKAGSVAAPETVKAAEAWVSMSGEAPTVGEVVEYHVKLAVPAGAQLDVPADLTLGEAAAIQKEKVSLVRRPLDGGQEELELVVPFVLVRTGRVKIPESSFPLLLPDGSKALVKAGLVRLTPGTLFPNENSPEPAGLSSTVPIVETNWLLIWTLVVLGAVGVTVLVTLLLRKRFVKPVSKPAPPPRPAHEVAFERLQELTKQNLPGKGEFMLFYVGLSEILRGYLGGRWLFDSLDMTTTELLHVMKGKALKNYDLERLQYMLDDFDLVKFAKVVPTLEQTDGDLGRVRKFVETTMVVPTPVQAQPPAQAEVVS